jgi:hypothetical protein
MVHGTVELDLALEQRVLIVANDFLADQSDPATRVAALTRYLQHNAMLYGLYRREAMSRAVFRQHRGQDTLFLLQMALIGKIRRMPGVMIRYRHITETTDNPIARRFTITLRGLVAWPTNRFKCLLVLYRGIAYLMGESGSPVVTRVRATTAFVWTFIRRFRRHLGPELVYALSAPLGWLLRPFIFLLKRTNHGWSSEAAPRP